MWHREPPAASFGVFSVSLRPPHGSTGAFSGLLQLVGPQQNPTMFRMLEEAEQDGTETWPRGEPRLGRSLSSATVQGRSVCSFVQHLQ